MLLKIKWIYKTKPSVVGLLKMLAGQLKIDFLTTTKILIVELSSQSCRKNPKHFTTKHMITKWVECVCRANRCQTFAFKALGRFESPFGSTRALFQSTDSHDSAVIGHWFALLMHALTDPDAEMAETASLPNPKLRCACNTLNVSMDNNH